MKARIIIPTAEGKNLTYDLRLRHGGGRDEFRIALKTDEENFERWLFYLLRDVGAHIVTSDPDRLRAAMGLSANEPGIVFEASDDTTRHFVKKD